MTKKAEMVELGVIQYDVTEAAIAEMKQFMDLTIAGMEDKEGYDRVHDARMVVKNTRVKIQKRLGEYKKILNTKKSEITGEAQRLIDEIQPIEDHLAEEEKRIDDEREAIRQEKIKLEEERVKRIQKSIEVINALGRDLIGLSSRELEKLLEQTDQISIIEDFYAEFLDMARVAKDKSIEAIRMALHAAKNREEEDAARHAESERLEKQRKEQESKEAALQAEQEAIEKSKREAEEQIRRARTTRLEAIGLIRIDEFFEYGSSKITAKNVFSMSDLDFDRLVEMVAEAVEKDKDQYAKEEAEREAKEKAEAEQREKERLEREEALKPDRDRFLGYLEALEGVKEPPFETSEMETQMKGFQTEFLNLIEKWRERL